MGDYLVVSENIAHLKYYLESWDSEEKYVEWACLNANNAYINIAKVNSPHYSSLTHKEDIFIGPLSRSWSQ